VDKDLRVSKLTPQEEKIFSGRVAKIENHQETDKNNFFEPNMKGGDPMPQKSLTPHLAKVMNEAIRVATDNLITGAEIEIIAGNIGYKKQSVLATLSDLAREGFFEKLGKGEYKIIIKEFSVKTGKTITPRSKKQKGCRSKSDIKNEIAEHKKRIKDLEWLLENYDRATNLIKE